MEQFDERTFQTGEGGGRGSPPGVLHMNLAVIAGFLSQHAAHSQTRSCMNWHVYEQACGFLKRDPLKSSSGLERLLPSICRKHSRN